MPARICVVSYRDASGLEHSAEVVAESLYEAAALAPGCGAEFAVTVRAEIATHRLRVGQLEDWLASAGRSPAEQALKTRLAEILGLGD